VIAEVSTRRPAAGRRGWSGRPIAIDVRPQSSTRGADRATALDLTPFPRTVGGLESHDKDIANRGFARVELVNCADAVSDAEVVEEKAFACALKSDLVLSLSARIFNRCLAACGVSGADHHDEAKVDAVAVHALGGGAP
jgi:hypothetical protein